VTEPHRCDNCDGIDPSSCINAPDRRDLLAALTREAVDAGTYGEPAPETTEPTLRDQIADAIRDAAHACPYGCSCNGAPIFATLAADDGRATQVEGRPESLADALMPVVEAALTKAERRAEQAEAAVERVRSLAADAIDRWEPKRDEHQERAERKGYTHDEAVAEASGHAIDDLTQILAALTPPEEP